jgi:chloramphenicol-sensitive protein RarD
MTTEHARTRAGLLLGLGAYLLWGVLPLYFKAIDGVAATEIVAHRIVWSLIFLGALVTLWRRWGAIGTAIRSPRMLATLTLTAMLIAVNWLVYIWAVLNGHVLAGSLGYYLNPLVNVLLGVFLLKERLTRAQALAVALAAAGVAVLAWGAAEGLWISLTLAASFATYGFLRKVAPVDSLEGLSIETAILSPIALGYILWLQQQGTSGFGEGISTDMLLVLGGAVTAVPLLLFTGRGQAAALFDAWLPPIYRALAAVPAGRARVWGSFHDCPCDLLRRDLDRPLHLRLGKRPHGPRRRP